MKIKTEYAIFISQISKKCKNFTMHSVGRTFIHGSCDCKMLEFLIGQFSNTYQKYKCIHSLT